MRDLKLSEESIAEAMKEFEERNETSVWQWQADAVRAFMLASTQWRYVSGASVSRTGLDYTASKVAWDIAGMSLTREDFEYVRVIEVAILNGGEDNVAEHR